jgi:hypothetical protein
VSLEARPDPQASLRIGERSIDFAVKTDNDFGCVFFGACAVGEFRDQGYILDRFGERLARMLSRKM